ncbi:lipopolysaccharide biosynthesis protein [Phytohabitans sp. LJ34]|uniref:lipopolysaccharide biosynthesis protein n=1 Tax=Phytohabitans sp. LJ34 TaxID=3452217 RepID=UPI003F8A8440
MTALHRRLVTPERVYMAALGFTGCAALVSVALPATERGELAASVASATLGAAIGSFSVDTFLLSRPAGWIFERGAWWMLAFLAGCLALAAGAAAALTALAGIGSYAVGVGAACALTVFNAFSSLALRVDRFLFVYGTRALGGAILVLAYVGLYAADRLDGRVWSVAWLAVQAFTGVVMCLTVLGMAWRYRAPTGAIATGQDLRADLRAMGKLHIGVCAQMLTYRLDQILIARFAGSGPLGVYALAVAALEFAQAGAVVRAQRILVDRERDDATPEPTGLIVRAALPVALAAVAGLGVVGLIRSEYANGWLYGLLLLPGAIAVAAGKTWSALLLKVRGEQATTAVALTVMCVAVALYFLLIPVLGAFGAALASSSAYAVYAVRTRLSLVRTPALTAGG